MERLEPLAESFDQGHDPKRAFLNRAINNAFNRDPHFVPFLYYPGVVEIAEALLGADCHVIAMTSWLTGPGRPDQMLHADYQPLTLPEDVMADPRVRIPVYISTAHYVPGPPHRGDRPDPLHPRQPPRRPRARRRHVLAGTRRAVHPLQRGRRGDLAEPPTMPVAYDPEESWGVGIRLRRCHQVGQHHHGYRRGACNSYGPAMSRFAAAGRPDRGRFDAVSPDRLLQRTRGCDALRSPANGC